MTVFRNYHNLVQKPRETYDAAPNKCLERPARNPNPPELLEVILAGESSQSLLPPVSKSPTPYPPTPIHPHPPFTPPTDSSAARCYLPVPCLLTIDCFQVSILLMLKEALRKHERREQPPSLRREWNQLTRQRSAEEHKHSHVEAPPPVAPPLTLQRPRQASSLTPPPASLHLPCLCLGRGGAAARRKESLLGAFHLGESRLSGDSGHGLV